MTNAPRAPTQAGDHRAQEAFALRDPRTQLHRLGSRRTLMALDLLALALAAGAYLQVGPPELLFHGVFLILTIDAFLYGRRVTLMRILASSAALLGYVALPAIEAGIEPLDLTEWPLMFAIAILVAWMADRERTAVHRYAGLYREARDRLVTAQEQERRRLSRDLHDGIGQTLTALGLAAEAGHLERARSLAAAALDEIRIAAERIRPLRLEARGLSSALHELALRCGVAVDVAFDPAVPANLPSEQVLELYRITQEALGNAVRHASADHVSIAVSRTRTGLRLEIVDDGVGFVPNRAEPRGLGLTGMRERAALMGGRLRIVSRPGAGTRITLDMPVREVAIAAPVPEAIASLGQPGGGPHG